MTAHDRHLARRASASRRSRRCWSTRGSPPPRARSGSARRSCAAGSRSRSSRPTTGPPASRASGWPSGASKGCWRRRLRAWSGPRRPGRRRSSCARRSRCSSRCTRAPVAPPGRARRRPWKPKERRRRERATAASDAEGDSRPADRPPFVPGRLIRARPACTPSTIRARSCCATQERVA